MSADRTVRVGEYGHSKVRCDGGRGRRCWATVIGQFRRGIKSARNTATTQGWLTGIRTSGGAIRDYCPEHRPVSDTPEVQTNG